jgi:hypothetical protein
MRRLTVFLAAIALAGCGQAPNAGEPGETATTAAGVAFAYRYDFRLPSSRIADAQEAHAQACEQLSPARCRITGMTYRLDGSGQVEASLDVRAAAPIARAFGRSGVKRIEASGGALTGAEIIGTDTEPTVTAATSNTTDAATDRAALDMQLARDDLTSAARTELLARRADLLRAERESSATVAAARASVATTPISFTYIAGSGVGLGARLSEAAHAGYLSLTWTLAGVLTLLAYLGPPCLLVLVLALLWHRVGRRWWRRAFPDGTAAGEPR